MNIFMNIFTIYICTINQAACINGWQTISDTMSSGATQQLGINTVSECKQNCINNAHCIAVDFVYNQCWVHTNDAHVNLKIRIIGATQYERCSQPGEFQHLLKI